MAITAPYSLELGQDDDLKQIVADTVVTAVADKIKIFFGASVDMKDRMRLIGRLKELYRYAKNTKGSAADTNPKVFAVNYLGNGSPTFAATTAGVAATDIAIVVDGAFLWSHSHFAKETIDQLIRGLIDTSSGN